MKTTRSRGIQWVLLAALLTITSHLSGPAAYGESYIGGQFGVTFPQSLSDGQVTAPGFTTLSLSDQALKTSLMGGIKAGFYLPRIRWFGLEFEGFYTTPHVKQQSLTFKGPGGQASTTVQGVHHRVIAIAPLNFMFRYHKTRLQPYVGIGPALFFAQIKDPSITSGNDSQSSNWKIGLNAQAGLRYYVTRHWTVFGEYKYNGMTRFNYKDTPNLFGFKADYSTHIVAFGISYHFQ